MAVCGVALRDFDGELLVEGVSERVKDSVGDSESTADSEAGVPELDDERELDTAAVADDVGDAESDGVSVPEGDSETVKLMESLSTGDTLRENVGDTVGGDFDGDAREKDADAVTDCVSVVVGDVDSTGVSVSESDAVTSGDMVDVWVGEGVATFDAVRLSESLRDANGEDVAEVVVDTDLLSVLVCDAVSDALTSADGECTEGVTELSEEVETVRDRVVDSDSLTALESDVLPESDGLRESALLDDDDTVKDGPDEVGSIEGVRLDEDVTVGVEVTSADSVGVTERALLEISSESDPAVGLKDSVADRLEEREDVGE